MDKARGLGQGPGIPLGRIRSITRSSAQNEKLGCSRAQGPSAMSGPEICIMQGAGKVKTDPRDEHTMPQDAPSLGEAVLVAVQREPLFPADRHRVATG